MTAAVNPTEAAEMVDYDGELLAELIDELTVHCPALLATMGDAARSADGARVVGAAHRLKGSLGALCAHRAAAVAASIESSAREGRLDTVPEQLDTLRSDIERAVSELRRLAADLGR